MKKSSRQILKAAVVGAGLIALLLAYRANDKGSASNENAFHVGNELGIRLTSPLETPLQTQSSLQLSDAIELTEPVDELIVIDDAPDLALEIRNIPLPAPVDPQWIDVGDQAADSNVEPVEEFHVESKIATNVEATEKATTVDYVQTLPKTAPKLPNVSVALSDAAAQKAAHHIEYGKSLARRSATEAAGQEFLSALRVLAEANDMAIGGSIHVGALRSGLLAMKEAADFKVEDPQRQIVMNVANIIDGHETQVIAANEASAMTASNAIRRYLEYAGHQLGTCGGKNVVAAEALYCLGKMRTISAQSNPDPESKELHEAIIFHHAAITADPGNHRSANELGVLLARSGQLVAAETYLKNSLKLKQTPHGWSNLAKVHQRKGTQQDQQLANLAMTEYHNTMHRQTPGVAGPIQMVGPQEFIARSPAQHPDATPTVANPSSMVVPASNYEDDSKPTFGERISSWLSPDESNR